MKLSLIEMRAILAEGRTWFPECGPNERSMIARLADALEAALAASCTANLDVREKGYADAVASGRIVLRMDSASVGEHRPMAWRDPEAPLEATRPAKCEHDRKSPHVYETSSGKRCCPGANTKCEHGETKPHGFVNAIPWCPGPVEVKPGCDHVAPDGTLLGGKPHLWWSDETLQRPDASCDGFGNIT